MVTSVCFEREALYFDILHLKSSLRGIMKAINTCYVCKNAASNTEQVLEATPHKAPAVRPPTTHHENYPS